VNDKLKLFNFCLINYELFLERKILIDPSRIHDSRNTTNEELNYRVRLEEYYQKSIGSNVEKLENFPKYVPRQSLTKFLAKNELFKKVLNVHGDIIECGVYLGGGLLSFAQLSSIYEPMNHKRKIIGFDTFSGFEKLSNEDSKSVSALSKPGEFAVDSYEDLKQCIQLYNSNRFLNQISKIIIIKGNITNSLPIYIENNPHTIVSLLYLDADVFEPTKIALSQLVPRIPKGGIIAFDELNDPAWPGETLAVLKTIGIDNIRIQRFQFEPNISYAVME